jgi:hypothetical protein
MDIKELGLEVKESRIEGILREIKEEIAKKDIRFIKLSDIHGRDIYINTNEIISIQEDSEDIDKGTITNITARWGMLMVMIYNLKIIFTNRETLDELVDEETIRDLMELYEYTKDKEFLFVSFKIKGIEINVKDIDKLYCTEC